MKSRILSLLGRSPEVHRRRFGVEERASDGRLSVLIKEEKLVVRGSLSPELDGIVVVLVGGPGSAARDEDDGSLEECHVDEGVFVFIQVGLRHGFVVVVGKNRARFILVEFLEMFRDAAAVVVVAARIEEFVRVEVEKPVDLVFVSRSFEGVKSVEHLPDLNVFVTKVLERIPSVQTTPGVPELSVAHRCRDSASSGLEGPVDVVDFAAIVEVQI